MPGNGNKQPPTGVNQRAPVVGASEIEIGAGP
jgi:hypothetical protein